MNFTDDNDIWKYRNIVIDKVSIINIAKEYGLELLEQSVGDFSHKTYCPFHLGKDNRQERTPSCFFSAETNSFSCFGCSKAGSIIDFVSLKEGCPPTVALTKLAKMAGVIDKDGKWDELILDQEDSLITKFDINKTIEPYIFNISFLLRDYINHFSNSSLFEKEMKWIDKVSEKVDEYLSNIGYEDWEYAKELLDKIKKVIDNRKLKYDWR
jgi:hypothetical protein